MAVGVVDFFEMVDVDHHRPVRPGLGLHQIFRRFQKVAAVADPRQVVRMGRPAQSPQVFLGLQNAGDAHQELLG